MSDHVCKQFRLKFKKVTGRYGRGSEGVLVCVTCGAPKDADEVKAQPQAENKALSPDTMEDKSFTPDEPPALELTEED